MAIDPNAKDIDWSKSTFDWSKIIAPNMRGDVRMEYQERIQEQINSLANSARWTLEQGMYDAINTGTSVHYAKQAPIEPVVEEYKKSFPLSNPVYTQAQLDDIVVAAVEAAVVEAVAWHTAEIAELDDRIAELEVELEVERNEFQEWNKKSLPTINYKRRGIYD